MARAFGRKVLAIFHCSHDDAGKCCIWGKSAELPTPRGDLTPKNVRVRGRDSEADSRATEQERIGGMLGTYQMLRDGPKRYYDDVYHGIISS